MSRPSLSIMTLTLTLTVAYKLFYGLFQHAHRHTYFPSLIENV